MFPRSSSKACRAVRTPDAVITLVDALSQQLDLEKVPVAEGITVYRNLAWVPSRALLPDREGDRTDWTEAAGDDLRGAEPALIDPDGPVGAIGEVPGTGDLLVASSSDERWQLRVGQSFLPTSRENVERLWVSPYTLTHSALNSWIGEELRPLGVDLSWRREFDNQRRLELGATVCGNNDASGALLAWRGFAWHDRLSYYGETLPLPTFEAFHDAFGNPSAGKGLHLVERG